MSAWAALLRALDRGEVDRVPARAAAPAGMAVDAPTHKMVRRRDAPARTPDRRRERDDRLRERVPLGAVGVEPFEHGGEDAVELLEGHLEARLVLVEFAPQVAHDLDEGPLRVEDRLRVGPGTRFQHRRRVEPRDLRFLALRSPPGPHVHSRPPCRSPRASCNLCHPSGGAADDALAARGHTRRHGARTARATRSVPNAVRMAR